jgi:cytochrome c oxidase subunit 2
VLDDIEAKKPNTMVVDVTAQQFAWKFEYPQQKVKSDDLVLAENRPVEFRLHTKDVLHSFWVPEFRLKSDIVPGITTKVRLTPNKPGHWDVVCAELCGLGHSTMRQDVTVLRRTAFDAWIKKKTGGGGAKAAAPDGKAVFASNGCASCHTFKPADASGSVGPDLDKLKAVASKREKGKSAEAYVREAITDPRAFTVKGFPKNVMPTTFKKDIPPKQLDALVQYLLGEGKSK